MPRTPRIVWLALLGGPAAWTLALMGSYLLVWDACDRDSVVLLHALRGVTALAALGATLVAYRAWRDARPRADREESVSSQRIAYLSLLAVLVAGISTFLIVIEWQANFFIHPCAA